MESYEFHYVNDQVTDSMDRSMWGGGVTGCEGDVRGCEGV